MPPADASGVNLERPTVSTRLTHKVLLAAAGLSSLAAAQLTPSKILDSSGLPGDEFGRVSVDGDFGCVGSWHADDGGLDSGAASIVAFDGSSWAVTQKLTPPDAQANDRYGTSTAVSGMITMVGAPGHDSAGTNAGAVYVYRFNGSSWVEEQKIVAADATSGGNGFGSFLDLSGDVAVIGAGGSSMGQAAYVFRHDSASWIQEFQVPNRPAVAVDGDLFVAGYGIESVPGASGAGAAWWIADTRTVDATVCCQPIDSEGDPTDTSWYDQQ